MNQTQALSKLRKVIGPKLGYRVDPKAPDAEQREAIRAAWKAAKQDADAAVAARKARYEELLAGDALYQDLKAKAKAAEEAANKAAAGMYRHRITVGVSNAMFFSVRAEGDNWDDVVAKVTKARGEAA